MTLTETAEFTKKGLVVSAVFFTLVILSWGGYQYWYHNIYLPSLPPKIEKPGLNFGVLPKLDIENSNTSQYTFTLDTETGDLPAKLPYLMKVYSVAQLATDLLALDRSKDLARSLGFIEEPSALSSTEYRFSDTTGNLTVNLDTGNFTFDRPEASPSANSDLERIEDFLEEDQVISAFKTFLSSKNLYKDELKEGKIKVIYNGQLKKDSTNATILYWQQDVDKFPIVTKKFHESLIKGVMTRYRDESKKFSHLEYTYWPIDYDHVSTYSIIPVKDAFEQLKNNGGAIIVEPKTNTVSITKVYLAYYLSDELQNYLQPVYVFEGPDFVGFVPAVDPKYLEK